MIDAANRREGALVGLLVLASFVLAAFGPAAAEAQEEGASSGDFRIVGYYPLDEAMKEERAEEARFGQVTHMNLAFVNPDSSGRFAQDFERLRLFIEGAHGQGVKVLYSIGGGAYQGPYHALLKEGERATLIENLVAKVVEHDVDGVDVDLEAGFAFGDSLDPNYGPFVIELARALKARGKLITTALPTSPGGVVSERVLEAYDFINVMAYDKTGPWSPRRAGNHSPYAFAMDALEHYQSELGVPAEKLVLGVPFYGHGFGPDLDSPVIGWMPYKEIAATYAGAEWVDHWHLPGGKVMYYNGIPTIKDKVALAKEEASGIMMWQLLYDQRGPKSLLGAINEAVY